uniref:3'-5' exonuclease domain-containing protein n=1 Tax=Ditylum brightwellii TaxID=49249 RepID=A0A7S2EQ59_9STRA|mmetsp:Transcript_38686/g.58070  ORF Transcript_38686/g.58070 Transcript_38686/m.58070 type:complete len:1288 (+) Transcript_38686:280-4143(+)
MTFSSSTLPSTEISETEEETSKKKDIVTFENGVIDAMKRLESRLRNSGITNYKFVPHHDEATTTSSQEEDGKDDVIVEVKTLIWQLIYEDEGDGHDNNEETIQKHHHNGCQYVITAMHAKHRVNEDNLKSLLEKKHTTRKIRALQLAPKQDAEFISGYMSGTIPPIFHATYDFTLDTLYMDQGIFHSPSDLKEEEKQQSEMKLSVGSGSLQYSLVLPHVEFKKIVEMQQKQLCIVSITTSPSKKTKEPMAQTKTKPTTTQPQKHISKRLRDAAGKRGQSDEVLAIIEEAGLDFPSLMLLPVCDKYSNTFTSTATKTYPTKNAVHLAAWKGDIESIQHMISTGTKFQLDLLNAISTGIGNYGKTPIFYALTQNRNDVVEFLLQQYPQQLNLCIVNNKGQSPCSMASSHLNEKLRDLMYEHETRQLRNGQVFVNYRDSHSDKKQYGDLDPRFTIDEKNDGEDVQLELQTYHQCRMDYYENHPEEKEEEGKYNSMIIPEGVPRTLRLTTVEKRKERADKHRKNAAAATAAMNLLSLTTDSTSSPVIDDNKSSTSSKKKKKKRPNPLYQSGDEIGTELKEMLHRLHEKKKMEQKERRERKESLCGDENESKNHVAKTSTNTRNKKDEKKGKNTNEHTINYDALETLQLLHIFPDLQNKKEHNHYELIDDVEGLKSLELEVNLSIQSSSSTYSNEDYEEDKTAKEAIAATRSPSSLSSLLNDEQLIHNSWGLDCEWKPSRTKGSDNPIATLQLSSNRKAFLVDLQSLCQTHVKFTATQHNEGDGDNNGNDSNRSGIAKMNKQESLLSDILCKLFSQPALPILGFGIGQDILKLAASFPHLPCFHLYHTIIDLHEVSRLVYPNHIWKKSMTSLRKSVATLLGKVMDKKEQCSDWETRPLSDSQLRYAALDSAILRPLLSKMLLRNDNDDGVDKSNVVINDVNEGDGNGSGDGYFLVSHPELCMSVRFTLLDQQFMSKMDHPHDLYQVEMGRVKKALDWWFARQSWSSEGGVGGSPALPKRLDSRVGATVISQQVSTESDIGKTLIKGEDAEKNSAPSKKENNDSTVDKQSKKRKKRKDRRKIPMMILDVPWEPHGLPGPGDIIGYTKENCVERVIGQSFLDSVPESFYLSYNRRGGVVELANAWILFVNFGVGKLYTKYQNEFRNEGRNMTFFVKPHKVQEASLLYYLSVSANAGKKEDGIDLNNIKEKKIFLFVRPSSNSKFMFCGKCACRNLTVYEEDVMLSLDLVDYDELVARTEGNDDTCDYVKMVSCHQTHLVDSGESAHCFHERTDE